MSLKALYIALGVLFYATLPLAYEAHFEKLASALRPDDPELATLFARVMGAVWVVTFLASVVVLKRRVALPFRLGIVTLVLSALLLSVTLLPILLFGRGWPPRPF